VTRAKHGSTMQHRDRVPYEELPLIQKPNSFESVFITSKWWETNLFQELICIHIQNISK